VPAPTPPDFTAGGAIPRRLFFYNAGFLRQPRLRRILTLAGHDLRLGVPQDGDGVVVWGRSPYAARGEAVAARCGVPVVRLEDAFLRSLRPGRMGDAPLGLMIDGLGVHFDSAAPSALERILLRHPFDNTNLMTRARDGMARIQALDLSKYNIHRADAPLPRPGYVLVVDQTRGDASITHSGASAHSFADMLVAAQEENPGARIVIKTHPETALGLRPGHYGAEHLSDRVSLCAAPVSPWALLDGGGRGLYRVVATGLRGHSGRAPPAGLWPALLCRLGPDRGPHPGCPPGPRPVAGPDFCRRDDPGPHMV
jgi:capsular polysaccharide export protein